MLGRIVHVFFHRVVPVPLDRQHLHLAEQPESFLSHEFSVHRLYDLFRSRV